MKENSTFRCVFNCKQGGEKTSFLPYLLLGRHGQTLKSDGHVPKTLLKGCHEVSLEGKHSRVTFPCKVRVLEWCKALETKILTGPRELARLMLPSPEPCRPALWDCYAHFSCLKCPVLPATFGPLYTFPPQPGVLYPPAASLPNFCISFSRDLSSCIHDTPRLGWFLHIYSDQHTGRLLCALWHHSQNCACSCGSCFTRLAAQQDDLVFITHHAHSRGSY